ESEIKVRGDTRLQSYLTPGSKPGKRMISPIKLSRDNQLVFAISDDYFSRRLNDGHTQGIIIRGGEVLSNETFKADHASLPNLEVIARFNDGSLKTFLSDAYTAEEYLAMGVTDTFAFGPILVSEGELGPHMQETDYYYYREPRCAIGMIAPNHYIILTVTGRTDDSRGERFNWLAERMIALGATEALNLDGGGTAALLFMGDMINKSNTSKTIRGVGSLIGFGTSPAATGSDQ
ncbi:MAG: phosphodiester glycosidase family protein, partial [Eubacteriales bacterium]